MAVTSTIFLFVAGVILGDSSAIIQSSSARRGWKVRRGHPGEHVPAISTLRSQDSHNKVKVRRQQLQQAIDDVAASLNFSKRGDVMSPHFAHSGRQSESFMVPYEVRTGPRGLGLFLTGNVSKGQQIWKFRPEDHFKIHKSDMHHIEELLAKSPPEVATWFVRWIYEFPQYCNCMLLETDDGRFTNDAYKEHPTIINAEDGFFGVASDDLAQGTELLESYAASGLDQLKGWWQPMWDLYGQDNYNQ